MTDGNQLGRDTKSRFPLVSRAQVFIRRWAKEIVIAVVLAIGAAIAIDPYLEEHKEKSTAELIKKTSEAVAVVTVFDKHQQPIAQGSGFFYSNDGKLITNFHVVKEPGISEIRAQVSETRAIYLAKGVLFRDAGRDIALLQFDAKETPYVRLGDSSAVSAGQRVVAIGAPLGLENTVSEGVISNPGRQVGRNKMIQFTAPISSGSSGGALLNRRGLVIGVTTASVPGTTEEPAQNLNFAVPINVVRTLLSDKDATLPTDKALNYYLIGVLESRRHNYDGALENFGKAITLDPSYADAYIEAADAFYEKGDFTSEVAYLEKAVALAPQDYEAFALLGSAYEDVGDYARAIQTYKQALKLKPDDKNSLFYLAFLSALAGDIPTAQDAHDRLAKVDEGVAREISALIKLVRR